jgi:hypothetical protein
LGSYTCIQRDCPQLKLFSSEENGTSKQENKIIDNKSSVWFWQNGNPIKIGCLAILNIPIHILFCMENKYVTVYHRKTCINRKQSILYASEAFNAKFIFNNIVVKLISIIKQNDKIICKTFSGFYF